jgi:hypothetical protein
MFLAFFENISGSLKVRKNLMRVTGTSHRDMFTFKAISRWILLRMGNVLDKSCRENQSAHFVLSNLFSEIAPVR